MYGTTRSLHVAVPIWRDEGGTHEGQLALAECGSVTEAARVVGKSTTNAYRLRQRSPDFAAAWDSALDRASALLEAAAYERALKGVEVPVWQGGKLMGHRVKIGRAHV